MDDGQQLSIDLGILAQFGERTGSIEVVKDSGKLKSTTMDAEITNFWSPS